MANNTSEVRHLKQENELLRLHFIGYTELVIPCLLVSILTIIAIFSIDNHFFTPAFAQTEGYNEATQIAEGSSNNAPRSFYRGISESIGVGTSFGNPASPPASNSYSRSLSDGLGVSSDFQSPARALLPDNTGGISSGNQSFRTPSSSSSYSASANQRIEERGGLRNLLLGNKAYPKNAGDTSSTVFSKDSGTGGGVGGSGGPGSSQDSFTLYNGGGSGEAASEDGSSSHQSISITTQMLNALASSDTTASSSYNLKVNYYSNAVYGVYSISIIGLAFRKSTSSYRMKSIVLGKLSRVPFENSIFNTERKYPKQLTSIASRTSRIVDAIIFASLSATIIVIVIGTSFTQAAYAVDTNAAAEAYRSSTGTNGLNSPKYREWNPTTSTWSSETELPTMGSGLTHNIRDVLLLFNPTNSERVILAYDASGKLELFRCIASCTTASNWKDIGTVGTTLVPSSTNPIRPFYGAYEQNSGRLVIAYDNATKTTSSFYFRTFSFGILSNPQSITFSGVGADVVNYIRMASKIGSNGITLVMSDGTLTKYASYAFIWNNSTSTFGNQQTISTNIGSTPVTKESIAVAYERSSGLPVVFSVNSGASAGTLIWYRWSGSAWVSIGTTVPDGTSSTPTFLIMRSDPVSSSNRVIICEIDTGSSNSAACAQENGGTLGSWTVMDTGLAGTTTRGVDFAWNPTGSTGIAIIDFGGSGGASYRTWSGSVWGSLTSISGVTGTTPWVQGATNPTSSDTMKSLWSKLSSNNAIGSIKYTGTGAPTVISQTSMTSSSGGSTFEGESVAFQLSTTAPNYPIALSDSFQTTEVIAKNVLTNTQISDFFITADFVLGDHNTNLAAIAYASSSGSGINFPKYREWNYKTNQWGSEVELTSEGSAVRFALIQFSPVSAKRVIVTLTSDSYLNSYVCDNDCTTSSNWIVTQKIASIWNSDPGGASRPFDMKFEQSSGNLMLVYDKASGDPNLFYRIMKDSDTSFGAEDAISITDVVGPVVYKFVRMDSRRTSGSNSIGLIASDFTNQRAIALVWDGSSWGNQKVITSTISSTDTEAIGIAYESNSGNLLAVAGISAGINSYIAYNKFSSSTSTWGSNANNTSFTVGVIKWVVLRPNPLSASNGIFLMASGSSSTLDSAYWSGASWTNHSPETSSLDSSSTRAFDFSWDWDNPGRVIMVWGDTSGQVTSETFGAPGAFSLPSYFNDDGTTHPWIIMSNYPNPVTSDSVASLGLTIDSSSKVSGIKWNGGTQAPPVSLGDNGITTSGTSNTESGNIDFEKSKLIKRFIADSISTTDSISITITRGISDSISTTDTIGNSITKKVADSMAITDSISKAGSKSITDSFATTDSIVAKVVGRVIAESIAVTDSVNAKVTGRTVSDSFATSDSISAKVSGRAVGDSFTTSDSIAAKVSGRTVSDSFTIADTISAKVVGRAITDSLAMTDSIAAKVSARAVADSFTINDVINAKVSARAISDSLTVGDSIQARITAWAASVTDSFSASDSVIARVTSHAMPVSDSVAASDSISVKIAGRAIADSLQAADSIAARITAHSMGVADSITASDSISAKVTGRALSDSLQTTDSIAARISSHAISIADSIVTSDAIAVRVIGIAISDSFNTADSVTAKVVGRAITDSLQAADSIAVKISGRSTSDSLGIIDSIFAKITNRAIADSIATTDSIVVMVAGRAVGDSLQTADSVSARITNHAVTVSDSISIADSISVNVSGRVIEDSLQAEDSITAKVRSKAITDSISIADSVAAKVSGRALEDSIAASDSIAAKITGRAISDLFATADAINAKVSGRTISDSLGITDSIQARITAWAASVTDSFSASDSVIARVTGTAVGDSVAASDSIAARITNHAVIVSDSISIADVIAAKVTGIAIGDSFSTSDSIADKVSNRSVYDSFATTDSISAKVSGRTIRDSFTTTDSISAKVSSIVVQDSFSTSDSINARVTAHAVSVADSITTTDAISPKIMGRAVGDSVATGDAITARITAHSIPVADSINAADSITARVTSIAISDMLNTIDSIAAKVTETAFADSITIADSISAKVSGKAEGDSLQTADSINVKVSRRAVTDSFQMADILSAKVTGRAISDSLATADSVSARIIARTEGVTDTFAATDSIVVKVSGRAVSDSLQTFDSILANVTGRTTRDSLETTDAILAKVTGRALGDSLQTADSVSARITNHAVIVSDSIATADAINAKVSGRAVGDSINASDSINAKVSGRTISDSLGITDSIQARITAHAVSVADSFSTSDSIADKVSNRSVYDSFATTDSISAKVSGRTISDTLQTIDAVSVKITGTTIGDSLAISDSVAAKVSGVAVVDSIAATDSIAVKVTGRAIIDSIGVTDSINAKVSDRAISDSLTVGDFVTANIKGKAMTDSLQTSDAILARISNSALHLADSFAATDSVSVKVAGLATSDLFTVRDTISTTETKSIRLDESLSTIDVASAGSSNQSQTTPRLLVETLRLTDSFSRSVVYSRIVLDRLTVNDNIGNGGMTKVAISDALYTSDSFSNIAIGMRLSLGESLILTHSLETPIEGNFVLPLGESLALGANFVPPHTPGINFNDSIMVSDGVTENVKVGRAVGEILSTSSKVDFGVILKPVTPPPGSPLPPLSVLVVTNDTSITPNASVSVPGTYSMTNGTVQSLIDQLKPPTLYINSTVSRPELPNMTMVLPSYHINMAPSPDAPTHNAMLSVKVAEIPANTNVLVPINMQNTSGVTQGNTIPWMKLEYTPKVNTTNFALVVSVLDDKPTNAETPSADLKPLYLNVKWVGDFPGTQDPSVQQYYKNPPKFTFAVTDQWANEQSSQRDSNGVPIVSLSLLNERTGKWNEVTSIDRPTEQVNGQYVYVAHLEHFSNYVITANKGSATTTPTSPPTSSSGGGASQSPSVPTPVITSGQSLSVFINDSVRLIDPLKSFSTLTIEEPIQGKVVVVPVSDSILVSTRPMVFSKTLELPAQNVTVRIGLDDISQKCIFPPLATATVVVEAENKGTNQKLISVNIWYYVVNNNNNNNQQSNAEEEKVSRSLNITIGPQSTATGRVDMPFTFPGKSQIYVEVKTIPSGDNVGYTTLWADIPWIYIYLYLVLIVAGSIIGISGVMVGFALIARKKKAETAGILSLVAFVGYVLKLIIGWRKTRSSVKIFEATREVSDGEGTEDNKYGLTIGLNLKEALVEEKQSDNGIMANLGMDVWNNRFSNNNNGDITLTFRVVDESGFVVHDSCLPINIPGKSEHLFTALRLSLPKHGIYRIHAEVKSSSSEDKGKSLDYASFTLRI